MDRSGWIRHVTLLQVVTIAAVFALVTMHTPAVSQAMNAGHGAQATMSASHMNGSACPTIQDQVATTPAAAEQLDRAPVVSADPPAHLADHAYRSLDQTTLSIWRT